MNETAFPINCCTAAELDGASFVVAAEKSTAEALTHFDGTTVGASYYSTTRYDLLETYRSGFPTGLVAGYFRTDRGLAGVNFHRNGVREVTRPFEAESWYKERGSEKIIPSEVLRDMAG